MFLFLLYYLYDCLCGYDSHPKLILDMNIILLMLSKTKKTNDKIID